MIFFGFAAQTKRSRNPCVTRVRNRETPGQKMSNSPRGLIFWTAEGSAGPAVRPLTRPCPSLLLTRDSGAEERFPCRGDLLLIGRDAETAVRLDHQSVSRFHARLVNAGEERWVVEDLGSSNGTFVNGIRVTGQVPLGHGDSVRFGTLALSFQDPLDHLLGGAGRRGASARAGRATAPLSLRRSSSC